MWTRISQPFQLPPEVRLALTTLYNAGHEAYLVGGCVRDWIRSQPIKDYDIATSAKPEEVEVLFSKVVAIGKAFGVMKVISENGREIEVATFRKESEYKDHRHPSKIVFSNVEADASRRDFTINALYYDLKTGQVLDFFGGLNDLKEKLIRAIGTPKLRFKEDALRLLRAVRFSARFGFQIEAETKSAIMYSAALINKVSIERIRDEIERMLTGPSCKQAFLELETLGLLENVLPEISVAKLAQKKVSDQTVRVLSHLDSYSQVEPIAFYWALLYLPTLRLHAIEHRDAEARKIAHRLKLSIENTERMGYLVRETPKFRDAFSMREATLLRWMSESNFELLMRFHQLDAVSYDGNLAGLEFVKSIYPEAKRRFHLKPLITGDDLVRLGMSPGRQFTEILRTIEDLALEGKLTTSEEALEHVLKHFVR